MKLKLKTIKFGEIIFYIDKKDLFLLENHKIYACKPNRKDIYLIRDDKKWLHKLIKPNCPKDYVVDHINRNTLDNRRTNLRFVSRRLNAINTNTLKLNKNEILEILLSDLSQAKLANKYNVSQCIISQIKTGKIYKHLFPDILRITEPFKGKLLESDVKYILKSKLNARELAEKFNLSIYTIRAIRNGKLYKKYCPEIIR